MAVLVIRSAPDAYKAHVGHRMQLSDHDALMVGSGKKARVRLKLPAVAELHAVIRARGRDSHTVEDLGSETGTFVDGKRLPPHDPKPLKAGSRLRVGGVEFEYEPEEVAKPEPIADVVIEPLSVWWGRAATAPLELDDDTLRTAAGLCGTAFLDTRTIGNPRDQARLRAIDWYLGYRTDPTVDRACLPIALPLLFDAGALIAVRQPPLRRIRGVPSTYVREYVERFLCVLAIRQPVKFVRGRTAVVRRPSDQRAVIGRFVGDIFNWLVKAWLDVTCPDAAARQEELRKCEGEPRLLTDPAQTRMFLIQLSQVVRKAKAFNSAVGPLEQFLLGARTRVKSAFEEMDEKLINECLMAQTLEECDFQVDPLRRLPRLPRTPSPAAGDHSAVRRVRKTNKVEKLPEAVPQDLAMARAGEHGTRLLVEKLYNDGLLIWERQHYDIEIRRQSFLITFVADTGPEAKVEVGTAGSANTASVHARRLIFEILGDLAKFVNLPDARIDTHVFLEPVDDRGDRRLTWALPFDQLQAQFGKSRYDDMVELEWLAPGFFFPRHSTPEARQTDHLHFLEEALERRHYDLTLTVFLGPERTLRRLLPPEPPPPRGGGAKDVVRLVQLGRWPTSVEVARGDSFAALRGEPEFDFCADGEFRYTVLEDILGRRKAAAIDADFDLGAAEGA